MIEVRQLTKRYVGRTAVDAISFRVEKGEIVGFLGPNGAGKTTTMRMLTGYLPPTAGTASIGGFDIFKDSLKTRAMIGYMPEDVPLYHDMRVKEYLNFRARLKGLRGRDARMAVGEAMDKCGVTEVRKKMIRSLSKGFRQRVGLADALVAKPALLILDEPTNGLDPNQIRQVRELIRELGENHTILLSTHILSEVEMTCGRVIIINRGKLCAADKPDKLVDQMRTAGLVEMEIKANPKVAEGVLEKIPAVKRVAHNGTDDEGWERFSLRVEANADARVQIHAAVVREGWPLRELHRRMASLEDVFVEITQSEQ
ncbi:MAG: ATP-binding cassette domain-containing protein [Verrucomicrobiales bacterium]